MLIDDYENSCWANDNISRSSRLLHHPMQQDENLLNGREHIDYFNVNTARSVERSAVMVMPEPQQASQQQQQEQKPVPLPVSHLASNGYYGYAYVYDNDNKICDNSTNSTNTGLTVPSTATTAFSSNEICTDNIEDQPQQQHLHHHQQSIERRKRQYDNNINNQSCFKRLRFENNDHQMEHEDSPMTNAMNCNGSDNNVTDSLNIIPSTATLNIDENDFIRAYNSNNNNIKNNNINEFNNNNCDVNIRNNSPETNFYDGEPKSNQVDMETLYWHLHGGVLWQQNCDL